MPKLTDAIIVFLILGLTLASSAAVAQEVVQVADPEIEVHLDLTRQFNEALGRIERQRSHNLSTDTSAHYLREIAVSTRFMVETNLRILQEQARIKQLLQELLARPRP